MKNIKIFKKLKKEKEPEEEEIYNPVKDIKDSINFWGRLLIWIVMTFGSLIVIEIGLLSILF